MNESIRVGTRRVRHLMALAFVGMALTLSAPLIRADVPKMISHQGRIMVGGSNFNGTGLFKFALVNSGGSIIWGNSSDTDGDGSPDQSVSLTVTDGLYSVLLGDTSITSMEAIAYSVFTNNELYLRVWFNDQSSGWQQLTPDQRVAPSGYALQAAELCGQVQTDSGSMTVSGDLVVDGYMGIGTSSPDEKLVVQVADNAKIYMHKKTDSDAEKLYNCLSLECRSNAGDRNYLKFSHGNVLKSQIYTNYEDDTDKTATLNIQNYTANDIHFQTNGANTRMTVKAGGKVGIGTTTPSTELQVVGTVTATSVVQTSDARYKRDVKSIDDALEIVKKMRGVYFRWREGAVPSDEFSTRRQIGFIGQEVEKALPEIVATGPDGDKAVAYQNVTPVLVEAVKEQQAVIDEQRRQLERQSGEIEELKTTLARLEKLMLKSAGSDK